MVVEQAMMKGKSVMDVQDEVLVMRRLVRQSYWQLIFQEKELGRAHERASMTHSLLKRADLACSKREALAVYGQHDEDDSSTPKSVPEYAQYLYGEALHCINWCEEELRKAHIEIASVKALLARANFNESEIDLKEEEYQVRAELESMEEKPEDEDEDKTLN
jgi:hypothetical protein